MEKKKFRSHCPINFAQETFGDRWSLLIIRDIMFFGKKYYGDFLKSDEKISTNILADRLEKLECMGLIKKSIDQTNQSKKIYSLTGKGIDLLPTLLEMVAWAAKYDAETEAPPEFIERLNKDRDGLIQEIRQNLDPTST